MHRIITESGIGSFSRKVERERIRVVVHKAFDQGSSTKDCVLIESSQVLCDDLGIDAPLFDHSLEDRLRTILHS
jgi:hypothetical protein